MLLTEGGTDNGLAIFNSIASGKTLAVVTRSSATGYYQFGHEIAHMYGAYHNREVSGTNPAYTYAYGYRFSPAISGFFGTILS